MDRFPDPVLPPAQVFNMRHERLRQMVSSSLQGIAVRLLIIIGEFVGVYVFDSAALLMDAVSSLIDIASSVLLVVFLKLAARPPDQNHPFGHGRYEPLVGLQLGLLMVIIGGGMLCLQALELTVLSPRKAINAYAWVIPFCAVILLEISYHLVMRAAKLHKSPALAADALHYRIDSMTSLLATVALAIASFFPMWSHAIDHVGALVIAVVMVGIGINALRQNLNQIVDHTPDQQYFQRVSRAALCVEGVRGTEKIRIQHSGPDAHVDIDIEVDPHLSVEVAHVISQKVRAEIQREWPLVQDVMVHIEPFYPNDH